MTPDSDLAVPSWAQVVTADNSGPMTLDGTNSWVLGSSQVVVVDPGPFDESHLLDLAMRGEVQQIWLTHGHADHRAGAQRLHELTGAPVRAWSQQWLHHADRFEADEALAFGDLSIKVLHTPGHTDDSVSFVVTDSDGQAALLTGDTILGRGTSVIAHPEGRLADYLRTLTRLRELGDVVVLPGHGPISGTAIQQASHYLAHRRERLDEVRAAMAGGASSAHEVLESVYSEVPTDVREAALLSVKAQMQYLQELDRS